MINDEGNDTKVTTTPWSPMEIEFIVVVVYPFVLRCQGKTQPDYHANEEEIILYIFQIDAFTNYSGHSPPFWYRGARLSGRFSIVIVVVVIWSRHSILLC